MARMLRRWLISTVAILLALMATHVQAQTTSTLTFTPSPDHSVQAQGVNVVDRYELVVTPQGGAPLAAQNLQKPTPAAKVISVDVTAYLNSLPPGTYTAIVRAVGPGGTGASPASAPFTLVVPAPGAPANPAIQRSGGS